MTTQDLRIADIRTDGGTQPRAQLDMMTLIEYAEAMQNGAAFPPVTVYYDGDAYWLADGFHRLHAAQDAKRDTIAADVKQGTRRDAVLYSVGANAAHGLRRTNADKRRAVETLLADSEWRQWSDAEIARKCFVTHPFVGKMRTEIAPTCNDYKSSIRKGADGRTTNTANIGKSIPQPTTPWQPRTEWEPPTDNYLDEDEDDSAPVTSPQPLHRDVLPTTPQQWERRIGEIERETPEVQALPLVKFISALHAMNHITDENIDAWLATSPTDEIQAGADIFQRIEEFAKRVQDKITKQQHAGLRLVSDR